MASGLGAITVSHSVSLDLTGAILQAAAPAVRPCRMMP